MRPVRDREGRLDMSERPLGLQVVEVATGRRLAGRESRAAEIFRAPGDGRLYLVDQQGRGRSTEVLDADTLERVERVSGWELSPAVRRDGRPILLARRVDYDAERTRLAIFNPRSYRPERSWTVDGYASWVVPAEP
jgi:hypothetical protein